MMRASRDAQKADAPDDRPFLVSRSGAVGMHRYAQTRSGDNSTSWETLKYNLKMGLGLALSGGSNTAMTSAASQFRARSGAVGPLGAIRRFHATVQHPFLA